MLVQKILAKENKEKHVITHDMNKRKQTKMR
jgi:hypothetical protein